MKPERLLAILLSIMFAGTACPGELILQSPLDNFTLQESAVTRLELSMSAYRGGNWTGIRNNFQLQRGMGSHSAWSLALPWIYSSVEDAGFGGRGNIYGGFTWSPPWVSLLSLGGETWLPFSDDRLAPLQVKRGFLRWSLASSYTMGSSKLNMSLSRSSELRGLIGDEDGDPWENWNEGEVRLNFTAWDRITPQLSARSAFRGSESLWTEAGGGFRFHWSEHWSLELEATAFISDLVDPFPALGIRLGIRRDFPDPVIEEEGADPEELSHLAREAADTAPTENDEGEASDEEAPPAEVPDSAKP